MPKPAPFLSIGQFVAEFGTLSTEQNATATRLLQVVADRIRQIKAEPDDDAAKQVSFEVVRDAITYGGMELLSSFQNVTSRRQEAGAFDAAMKVVDDYLSDKHKRLLGVVATAAPRGHFVKCDY